MRFLLTLEAQRPFQRWSLIWVIHPVPGFRYFPLTAWKVDGTCFAPAGFEVGFGKITLRLNALVFG